MFRVKCTCHVKNIFKFIYDFGPILFEVHSPLVNSLLCSEDKHFIENIIMYDQTMQASTHKTYNYCACSCHMINKSSKRSNGSATKLSIPIRLVFSILNLHLLLCAYFLMISECIHATYICIQKLLLSMSMSFVFSGGGRSHGHVILTFLMIYQCNNKYVCQVGRYVGQKAYHLF